MASDAEQSAADLAWLESEAEKRQSAADWSERRARDSTSEFHRQQYVRDARRFGDEAGRFRRIVGSVRERERVDEALRQLENIRDHCYQPDRMHCSGCDESLRAAIELLTPDPTPSTVSPPVPER